jgi:hypothetical protein
VRKDTAAITAIAAITAAKSQPERERV